MKELVKITDNNGKKAVSARELHRVLKSARKFTDWFDYRKTQYELIEKVDYQSLSQFCEKPQFGQNSDNQSLSQFQVKTQGGRPTIDYALSLECAKQLAMIENN